MLVAPVSDASTDEQPLAGLGDFGPLEVPEPSAPVPSADQFAVLIFSRVWQHPVVFGSVGEETPPRDAAVGPSQARIPVVILKQSTSCVPTALHRERRGTTPGL